MCTSGAHAVLTVVAFAIWLRIRSVCLLHLVISCVVQNLDAWESCHITYQRTVQQHEGCSGVSMPRASI